MNATKTIKRKKPTSDAQREVVLSCTELLAGVESLTRPDYHKLNRAAGRNDRLLHAVLCAYAKHHLDCEDIGWNQLDDLLQAAICNEIGDDAFCRWLDVMREPANDKLCDAAL